MISSVNFNVSQIFLWNNPFTSNHCYSIDISSMKIKIFKFQSRTFQIILSWKNHVIIVYGRGHQFFIVYISVPQCVLVLCIEDMYVVHPIRPFLYCIAAERGPRIKGDEKTNRKHVYTCRKGRKQCPRSNFISPRGHPIRRSFIMQYIVYLFFHSQLQL